MVNRNSMFSPIIYTILNKSNSNLTEFNKNLIFGWYCYVFTKHILFYEIFIFNKNKILLFLENIYERMLLKMLYEKNVIENSLC